MQIDRDTVVPVTLTASFFAFMAIERVRPARRAMPQVRHWRLIGTGCFFVTMLIYGGAPALLVPLVRGIHLVDLSRWGG